MAKRGLCILLAMLTLFALAVPAFAAGPSAKLAAPTVTISKASNGIKVSWNKVTGSPRYMVYYKENGGSWKRIGTTASTTYTRKAANLKNGATYQFTVRCCANDKKTLLGPYKASNSIIYQQQAQFKIGAYQDTRDNYETYALFVTNVTDSTITFSVFAYRWTSIINVTGKISGNKVTFANENVEGYLTLSDNGKIVMTLTSANDLYIRAGVFTYEFFGTATDYWTNYYTLHLIRNDDTEGWCRTGDTSTWGSWNCPYNGIYLRFFDDGTFTYWLGTSDGLDTLYTKYRGTYSFDITMEDIYPAVQKLLLNGDEYNVLTTSIIFKDIEATGDYAIDFSGRYELNESDVYIWLNR